MTGSRKKSQFYVLQRTGEHEYFPIGLNPLGLCNLTRQEANHIVAWQRRGGNENTIICTFDQTQRLFIEVKTGTIIPLHQLASGPRSWRHFCRFVDSLILGPEKALTSS